MMHQKKNKNEQPGVSPPEAVLKLLPLLETPDVEFMESILNIIHENLCGTKDSRLLNGIVDYYIATESLRSIDILLRLKEPHDKHLFDKMSELMKNENSRYKSLQLFMNLVHKQPSWLHKTANHRIMSTLISILKTDVCALNLVCGLFTLLCLLPMLPHQFGHFLPDIFEIFSRLATWVVKKPSSMIDVYMLHLHNAIYSLFHCLYGLFPCNFLAYLRSYYGGQDYKEDKYRVFSAVIKPMLERVRLHPLLVTASKETELSTTRWKKMAYHDIIHECALISLDFVGGTEDSARNKMFHSSIEQNFNSLDSSHFMNCSSQSSCSITYEAEGYVAESSASAEPMWSPNNTTVLASASSTATSTSPLLKSKPDFKSYCRQISSEEVPLDIAVEAKPEVMLKDVKIPTYQAACSKESNMLISSDALELNEISKSVPNDKFIIPAVEAKEDDIDREVSELTSRGDSSPQVASADTPFCSTTQNLTEKPGESYAPPEDGGGSRKSSEDDADEMYSSIPESEGEGLGAFHRCRFLSYNLQCVQKPKVFRSVSCPENIYPPKVDSATPSGDQQGSAAGPSSAIAAAAGAVSGASAFVPVPSDGTVATLESGQNRLPTFDKLAPGIFNPLSLLEQCCCSGGEQGCGLALRWPFSCLSPPQLLDRYIQLGSATCLDQLRSIPITSMQNTDWTHFGGKPPADEVLILRNQIQLVHTQLLFERHRKDVHSERNRRILGKAKKFKMQDEHIGALKGQISLLEQDNKDLKQQVEKKTKSYHQLLAEKQQLEQNLRLEISKAEQENTLLLYSNNEIKALLVSQRKENDEIREIYKRSQSEITQLKHQVERANRKALQCQKIEKDSIFLSKQLILMQELITHYKDRIELLKENHQPDLGDKIMENAALIQIESLKQKLDAKHSQLDSLKTAITQLEQSQIELKTKVKDHVSVLDKIKALHQDEISVREMRLKNLKTISAQKDAHILHLYKCLESMSEEKKSSVSQACAVSSSNFQSTDSEEVPDLKTTREHKT